MIGGVLRHRGSGATYPFVPGVFLAHALSAERRAALELFIFFAALEK